MPHTNRWHLWKPQKIFNRNMQSSQVGCLCHLRVTPYISIYIYVCLSLFIYIYLYLFYLFYLSVCLSICLSACLSIYLSVCLSIWLPIYLSVYVFAYLSVYQLLGLTVFLSAVSVYLSTWKLDNEAILRGFPDFSNWQHRKRSYSAGFPQCLDLTTSIKGPDNPTWEVNDVPFVWRSVSSHTALIFTATRVSELSEWVNELCEWVSWVISELS